jgi:hypothetical protein
MDEMILDSIKNVAALGGGGIVGGLIATWKLKAEMMMKKDCEKKQKGCANVMHHSMDDLKEDMREVKAIVEKMRDHLYVIRTNGTAAPR